MSEATRTLNLLIVEDEALIAMTIEDALTADGHRVIGVADTLESARDHTRAHAIDLALCDVRLANGDSGIQVASELARQGIPVVYLSGNCPPASSEPLVVGCISKPFHAATLPSTVLAAYRIAKGEERGGAPQALTLYT